MKGMSVKRIAEIFRNTSLEPKILASRTAENHVPDNEEVLMNSLHRKLNSVNTSQESAGNKTQDSQYHTPRRIRPSSLTGNPIRLRLPIAPSNDTSMKAEQKSKSKIDWKYVDNLDVGCDENHHIDTLVRESLFSKKKNAFNMVEKTKMFVTLHKKNDNASGARSLNTKETTKDDQSNTGKGSCFSLASSQNIINKEINPESLRQQYLAKLQGKGIGDQMRKPRVHIPLRCKASHPLETIQSDTKEAIPQEPISMRIRLTDRLNILKSKGELPKTMPMAKPIDKDKLLK
jgi:hypothetical protein